jgi:hypothetical protein
MRITPCLAVLAIATGCTSAPGSAPEPASTATSGALTVDWTIRGTTDANQCTSSAAAAIEITVLSSTNQRIGSFQQSCTAFGTSISLEAGIYVGTARLLDRVGAPRTRPVGIPSLTINATSELTQPIDFPADAFF